MDTPDISPEAVERLAAIYDAEAESTAFAGMDAQTDKDSAATLRALSTALTEARAENARLRDWLDGIRQYGSDTLAGPSRDPSGSAFVPDDRNWHHEGVLKMMRRAIAAISGDTPEWADEARAALQEKPHAG